MLVANVSMQPGAGLVKIEVLRCEMNSPIFKPTNSLKIYHPSVSSKNLLSLPYEVPARSFCPLVVDLEVQCIELDQEKFVRQVRELNTFQLELCCHYEDMDGNTQKRVLTSSASYEGFRKAIKKILISRKEHDLVYLLTNLCKDE